MSPAVTLLAGFAAGAAVGAVYFRVLWLTVTALEHSRRPGARMAVSLAVRFALMLAVLYLITRYGGWQPLLAAAAGFTAVRLLAVRRVSRAAAHLEAARRKGRRTGQEPGG